MDHHTGRTCYSQKHFAFPVTGYARIKSLSKVTMDSGCYKAENSHFDILQEVALDSSLRHRPSDTPNQYLGLMNSLR